MVDMRKCAIIGCGNVGATAAFALIGSGLFSEMVLIDINKERARGEAEDLGHGVPFHAPLEIYAGEYRDLADAGLIIIAAGAAQREGETRLDLVRKNTSIFRTVIGDILPYNREAILLVVTNPVDILTEVTLRLSGFPAHRVIGSGTVLDTARLKFLLGKRLGVDARQVHAFIIGEHGDTELPVYSSANISGIDLAHFCGDGCSECGQTELEELFYEVRDAAYHIIRAKGATYYAIAEAVRRIVTAIVRDEAAILPLSVATNGAYGYRDLCLSLPSVVGAGGVKRVLEIPLSDEERARLELSATRMREVLNDLNPALR
ncbi:MAG: L-lactate dehydrogenase [Clostridia bacterium]|nr:L-lactate dehydrogenase [Clostridia bacterium]